MVGLVPEISNLDDSHSAYAMGFVNDVANVDATLPDGKGHYSHDFGSLFKKCSNIYAVKIYKTQDINTINHLIGYDVPSVTLSQYKHVFAQPKVGAQFIVKVSTVSTYRQLLTCYKEAIMTNKIYSTERNDIKGADLVCTPVMCVPVFKKTWRFVFVSSIAQGVPVSSLLGFWKRTFYGVKKQQMYQDLEKACDSLWRLGFAHNDLHPCNVMYDVQKRKVTFIDLETAVEVLPNVATAYIETMDASDDVSCYVTFNRVMLEPALNMLRLSEKWLHEFTSKPQGECRVLYNIDSEFLLKIREELNC